MKRALVILLFYACTLTNAQNQSKVDSLVKEMQKYEEFKKSKKIAGQTLMDSTKVLLLNDLNREYREFDTSKALYYAYQCLELSNNIGYKKGVAHAYNDLGHHYFNLNKNKEAEEYFNKSMAIRKEILDSDGISSSYNNLALLYRNMGDDARGISSFQASLRYSEGSGNKRMMATTYHNMGLVYSAAGNLDAALESFNKARTINTEINNTIFLRYNLGALAGLYETLKQYEQVIRITKESIKLNNLYNIPSRGENAIVGNAYVKLYNYAEALRYFKIVADESNRDHDTNWLTQIHLNIGKVYHKQNKLAEARQELLAAVRFSYVSQRADLRRESLAELVEVYGKEGNYRAAWQSHVASDSLKDTTDNVSQDKEKVNKLSRLLLQASFDKQRDSLHAAQEKKDSVEGAVRTSILAALAGSIVFLAIVYRQRNRITTVNHKNEELLLNILPAEVAEELRVKGSADAKFFDNVSVLFTDFKSFTTISEQLTPQELVNELHACFKEFDEICGKYNIEKIKTIGDAYLAVSGLPIGDSQHAEKAVRAALDIRDFMDRRVRELGEKTFAIRIGIHSGSVVAGIVGVKKYSYDVWGDTVNTAARMEQMSDAGKINVSETTYSLVKESFACEYRGEIDAKNKGKLNMYFVEKL